MCECGFKVPAVSRICHCAGCCHTFASLNGFEWHQKLFFPYGPVCLDPASVRRKDGSRVLFQDSRGYWREHRPDLREISEVMRERFSEGEGAAA